MSRISIPEKASSNNFAEKDTSEQNNTKEHLQREKSGDYFIEWEELESDPAGP